MTPEPNPAQVSQMAREEALQFLQTLYVLLSAGNSPSPAASEALEDALGDVAGFIHFARRYWSLNESEIVDRSYARFFNLKEKYEASIDSEQPDLF